MGIARVKIELVYLKEMFTDDKINLFRVLQGIPENAKLIIGEYDNFSGNFYIYFEHPDIKSDFDDCVSLDIIIQDIE
jgi:hypothetical protein